MPKKRDPGLLVALGERLQKIRRERGWTQEQLAEAMNLQPVTLSRLETGDRAVSVSILADAARVLGVKLADILDIDLPMPEVADEPEVAEGTAILRTLAPDRRELAVRLLREVGREPGKRRGGRRSPR